MSAIYLGDARAEQDSRKLKSSFFESPDYRTIIESDAKSIVVGRRGVGKSALFLRLSAYYGEAERTEVIRFAPEEDEVIGFRPVARLFDSKFKLVRSATRVVFRYALMMEIADSLSRSYKFRQCRSAPELTRLLDKWRQRSGLLPRARLALERAVEGVSDAESRIGALAAKLDINYVESLLDEVLHDLKRNVVILVDRLDEGYEPDEAGIGVVDGFIHAAIDLRDRLPSCRSVMFLRDNIFRAVEQYDQDFSRNLEQSVLRLHWDERALLTFVANRIRDAANIRAEKSIKVWDAVTQGALQGETGFHSCLRLTLYRPRDLLLLLNDAFGCAFQRGVYAADPTDIDASAKSISENRYRDLIKEYSSQLPGIDELAKAFSNRKPVCSLPDATALVNDVLLKDAYDPKVQQQFAIYANALDALRALYSVGFIGVKEAGAQSYVYCHDGRKPDRDFGSAEALMVHPCYWIALNAGKREIEEAEASEIHDEYDVRVTSETPEQRARMLGRLENELNDIEVGLADAHEFERWCHKAIQVLFSGGLRNIEHHPNKSNLQRRDVVGTNHGTTALWARVLDCYGSRQVLFEVKNFAELTREEFWQMNTYLCKDYGTFGIIVTRGDDINLRRERELAWVRELKNQHGKVVLLITAKFLAGLLRRVRSPLKHDAAEEALDKLLDTYVRTYFGEPAPKGNRKKIKKKAATT